MLKGSRAPTQPIAETPALSSTIPISLTRARAPARGQVQARTNLLSRSCLFRGPPRTAGRPLTPTLLVHFHTALSMRGNIYRGSGTTKFMAVRVCHSCPSPLECQQYVMLCRLGEYMPWMIGTTPHFGITTLSGGDRIFPPSLPGLDAVHECAGSLEHTSRRSASWNTLAECRCAPARGCGVSHCTQTYVRGGKPECVRISVPTQTQKSRGMGAPRESSKKTYSRALAGGADRRRGRGS